jgi:hypothetical protein
VRDLGELRLIAREPRQVLEGAISIRVDRARCHSELALRLRNIEMHRESFGQLLQPFARDTDAVRHGEQRVERIRPPVANKRASEGMPRIVDIHGHGTKDSQVISTPRNLDTKPWAPCLSVRLLAGVCSVVRYDNPSMPNRIFGRKEIRNGVVETAMVARNWDESYD